MRRSGQRGGVRTGVGEKGEGLRDGYRGRGAGEGEKGEGLRDFIQGEEEGRMRRY